MTVGWAESGLGWAGGNGWSSRVFVNLGKGEGEREGFGLFWALKIKRANEEAEGTCYAEKKAGEERKVIGILERIGI